MAGRLTKMENKITIAWDIDDVLNNLMTCWLESKWKLDHLDCSLNYQDLKENPPHKILGVSFDEYLQSLDEFRLSRQYLELKPSCEILNWFKSYGFRFRHIALTAVPVLAAHQSAFWVMKNFGLWIRTFHFVPSKRTGEDSSENDLTKADYLSWLNNGDAKVQMFVDDNEVSTEQVEKVGIRSYLVPRPWNQSRVSLDKILSKIAGGNK